MVAPRAALEELTRLACPGPSERVLVCTDFQSSLALLQAGPEAQRSVIGADVWRYLMAMANAGARAHLQWVPAHCCLPRE